MEKRYKPNRPQGFHGYYVEVRPGEDAVRAYRKIKRWIKEDKFIDQIRANNTYQKPSEIKREKAKEQLVRKRQTVQTWIFSVLPRFPTSMA